MKIKMTAVFAMTLAASAIVPHAVAADGPKGGGAVLMPASEIKWTDVADFPGLKMAAVQGDPAKGAHHAMLKLPAGFTAPLHHHSSDHFVTVVSGTMTFTVDGKDTKLPPGSYFSYTGKKQHITKCDAGADCILSMDTRGKWDVVPEKEKAAAKK